MCKSARVPGKPVTINDTHLSGELFQTTCCFRSPRSISIGLPNLSCNSHSTRKCSQKTNLNKLLTRFTSSYWNLLGFGQELVLIVMLDKPGFNLFFYLTIHIYIYAGNKR
ncbi:hypothetical protein Y032_0135g1905 [Ancylostoma ceylanicum]|nr:hypothetical protein Y032_0135g1905 [Ancylostoma ceylanicum]